MKGKKMKKYNGVVPARMGLPTPQLWRVPTVFSHSLYIYQKVKVHHHVFLLNTTPEVYIISLTQVGHGEEFHEGVQFPGACIPQDELMGTQ